MARYEDFEAMAHKLSWRYAKRYNMNEDELMSEALFALVNAIQTHRPEKATLSTWAYFCMSNSISTFCSREHKRQGIVQPDEGKVDDCRERIPAKTDWVHVLLSDLEDEAKELVHIILEGPAELVSELFHHKAAVSRDAVKEHLRGIGWSEEKLVRCWTEVQDAL